MIVYVDTSVLAKTAVEEAESSAVLAFLAPLSTAEVWSSALTRTELVRAVRRVDPQRVPMALDRLAKTSFIALDRRLLDAAAALEPPSLRSLDALHVASALRIQEDLDAVLTYDERIADAARDHGLAVLAPV